MIGPARVAAYEVLRAVSSRRADLPAALALARARLPDERDRALAGEIATGTLRWQGTFDHIIAAFARRSLDRLDPEVVDILRLTLFQLLHLDRVPASAAVNDAVDLVRKAGKGSAASFANALLRRVTRERARLPLPPRVVGDPGKELDYLEAALSHPRWLVQRWRDRYGFDATESWCLFNNAAAALTLRANRLRGTREELMRILADVGVRARPARFAPDALVVESGNPLLALPPGQGLFVVQDEASQLVARLVAASPGEQVLDACASPGGKTTAMAADMNDSGLVVSLDVRPKRVSLLAELVRNSGARSVRVVQADAARPLPFQPVFDAVLVDAPCSGLGTLRRDPDIKWRRNEPEFAALAGLQLDILESAAAVVRPGGRIVYATCSSEPEENEAVVQRFLERRRDFRANPLSFALAPELINSDGHFRSLPFRDGLEAFFAASVVKAAELG